MAAVVLAAGALGAAPVGSALGGSGTVGASADTRPPSQTIFASGTQRVGSLKLLITVHERGKLVVTARAGGYRFRSYSKRVVAHIPNQVRLSLSATALRSARRSIKKGRSLTATVHSTGRDAAGNDRTYTKRIRLRA